MFDYPIEKYKFYTATKVDGQPYGVIAVSTYEGRIVRGVAKCDPKDNFDLERGKQLAAARCGQKIAEKRAARAKREYKKAQEAFDVASRRLDKMNDYKYDAKNAAIQAKAVVAQLLKDM